MSTGHPKMSGKKNRVISELYLTRGASQRTRLSGVKLKLKKNSSFVLKLKHSVSIGVSCSGFSFYENFNWQVIQNRKMCLSEKIFCQYFVDFLPCLGHLSKHFMCHYVALKTEKNKNHP